jgi:V8-like Glu-specific endopeptidase
MGFRDFVVVRWVVWFSTATLLFSIVVSAQQQRGDVGTGRTSLPPAIELQRPTITPRGSIDEAQVRKDVEATTAPLDRALTLEGKAIKGIGGAPGDFLSATIIDAIPLGYSTLLSTANAVPPGKPAGAEDPRVVELAQQPLIERIIRKTNLLPVRFLEMGALIAKPVARVAIKFIDLPDAGIGTGFMVSPTLFLTNNHVLGTAAFAAKVELHFNYQYGVDGAVIQSPTVYELDPQSFFYTNVDLDFTLVRVKRRDAAPSTTAASAPSSQANAAGEEFGVIPLRINFFYSKGQLANVIQHPGGRPKEIALHENEIDDIYQNVIRYQSDTEPGSSGSPVFNNSWRLIALHHSAGAQDKNGVWLNNEGVRIDRIIEHLRTITAKKTIPPDIVKELGL